MMKKNDRAAAFRLHGRVAAALTLTGIMGTASVWPALVTAQEASPSPAPAASPPPSTPGTPVTATAEPLDVQVFQGVEILAGPSSNAYPYGEVMGGREGWVTLNMMIDPHGKPYEVMVTGSSGNPAFEKAALRAVNQVKFAPARSGDTPFDSAFTFKMKFAIRDLEKGADPKFVSRYRRFTKAINEGNKEAADKLLPQLEAQNLYEEAFEHYGRYFYFQKWGTPEQQLSELSLAIAGESQPEYLPKEVFVDALTAMFVLQLKQRDYGGALQTWSTLDPLAPKDRREKILLAVNQIRALQAGTEPVRLEAAIDDNASWGGDLFRNQFSLDVTSGVVSEIKLRCQKKYLMFRYQPGIQYSIGRSKDTCGIQVVGDPGTKFVLTQ